MFDGLQIYQTRPNKIKYDQARSNCTKQGAQTVKCLLTKQCLMVLTFGRQTFLVCPGLEIVLLVLITPKVATAHAVP